MISLFSTAKKNSNPITLKTAGPQRIQASAPAAKVSLKSSVVKAPAKLSVAKPVLSKTVVKQAPQNVRVAKPPIKPAVKPVQRAAPARPVAKSPAQESIIAETLMDICVLVKDIDDRIVNMENRIDKVLHISSKEVSSNQNFSNQNFSQRSSGNNQSSSQSTELASPSLVVQSMELEEMRQTLKSQAAEMKEMISNYESALQTQLSAVSKRVNNYAPEVYTNLLKRIESLENQVQSLLKERRTVESLEALLTKLKIVMSLQEQKINTLHKEIHHVQIKSLPSPKIVVPTLRKLNMDMEEILNDYSFRNSLN